MFNKLQRKLAPSKNLDPLVMLPTELAEIVCQNLDMRDRVYDFPLWWLNIILTNHQQDLPLCFKVMEAFARVLTPALDCPGYDCCPPCSN